VEALLTERQEVVHGLLEQHRAKLDLLVSLLLREETAGEVALTEVLGPRAD
jgi:ATP-dependent Zn protease